MHRYFTTVVVILLASTLAAGAWATPALQSGDAGPPIVPLSQIIREAGHALSDAEAAYLDADQLVQAQYAAPLFRVIGLAGPGTTGVPEGQVRLTIESELQSLAGLDPSAAPVAPPSLSRFRELAVEHRTALRRAAAAWLAGLQAADPDWRDRGAGDFAAAQQSLATWQQELLGRYPPPSQP
jgi:hypothetical protein